MRHLARPAALALFAGLLLALASPLSRAHEVAKGPHGGTVVTVEPNHIHLELTTNGPEIVVYVTDKADAPIATAGASGRAVIQMSGKTTTVTLAPGEGNRLSGKAEAPVTKGARVVVSASLAGGVNLQARFVTN